MSSKPEPSIWPLDTKQGIAWCDSWELTITWMPKINSFGKGATLLVLAYGRQPKLLRYVTKFSMLWDSSRASSAHRSSDTCYY